MGKRAKIKAPRGKQGTEVKSQEPPNFDNAVVKFSLERLQPGNHCLSQLDQANKAKFADAIYKRKDLTWKEIKRSDRHALGTEKIAVNAVKAPKPPFITEEINHYTAFRYNGKAPMVGYRVKDIFYVLWFDPNYELYDH